MDVGGFLEYSQRSCEDLGIKFKVKGGR
jgi:hypothetical protein